MAEHLSWIWPSLLRLNVMKKNRKTIVGVQKTGIEEETYRKHVKSQ